MRRYSNVTGVVLLGGHSRRFGSPKALARLGGESLAERAWRVLGEAFPQRLAVGKADDGLDVPFAVTDDGIATRAPLAGVVAALRHLETEIAVIVPVDMPRLDAAALRRLADACRDAAVPPTGPLPGAYRTSCLRALETRLAAGDLKLRDALDGLDVAVVALDTALLVNLNDPEELARLTAAS
jgi:molybdopterin-guanine dinucleotide biosynthesis protein A